MEWWKEILSLQTRLAHIIWGAIFMSLVRLWFWAAGKPIEKRKAWAFWGAGVLGTALLLALLQRMQQQNEVEREGRFRTLYAPQLAPSFKAEWLDFDVASPANSKDTLILLHLKVYNTSQAPSIIHGWTLQIKTPDKDSIRALLLADVASEPRTIPGTRGGETITLQKSDWLIETVGRVPLQPGAMQEGRIAFVVPTTSMAFLRTPGMIYEVSYKDVRDKTYSLNLVTSAPPRN